MYMSLDLDFSEISSHTQPNIVTQVPVSLHQNYPNPFNPETTFKYLVAEDGEVNISVYNLLGKEIKQLVSGNKAAGYYPAGRPHRSNYTGGGTGTC